MKNKKAIFVNVVVRQRKFRTILILIIFFSGIFFGSPVSKAAIIWGDNFDSQPDWDMSQSADLLSFWTGKLGENRGGDYEVGYINTNGAHGVSGKGFIQYWDQVDGGYAQDSWLTAQDVIDFPNEWYMGYWFKVDPNWDLGDLTSVKIMKIHFNDGTTWDLYWTNFIASCGDSWCNADASCEFQISSDEWAKKVFGCWSEIEDSLSGPNNDGWNYFIWHFNHSENLVELEIDGVDAVRVAPSVLSEFPGTGWDGSYGLSFGGNVTNGGGGVDEMWQAYDDVVITTTKEDTEDFLGIAEADTTPPSYPTGLSVE